MRVLPTNDRMFDEVLTTLRQGKALFFLQDGVVAFVLRDPDDGTPFLSTVRLCLLLACKGCFSVAVEDEAEDDSDERLEALLRDELAPADAGGLVELDGLQDVLHRRLEALP